MSMSRLLWRLFYRRWPERTAAPIPGYSLLVPVPGDLPVFLRLALFILRKQASTHRVETLVIPDVVTPRMRAILADEQQSWGGKLSMVEMPRPDRWIPKCINRPHHNHWLQLINGVRQASASHALLHDADLFLSDTSFHQQQFERCVSGHYACFGVHRVWDDWFEQHEKQITATWEMIFETDWARSFPPHLHLGHDGVLDGEKHTFDTTLFPQCMTEPQRIAWHSPASGLIHFNYVICSYRYYLDQQIGYEDEQFRLLLIRILIDLFDRESPEYPLPIARQLQDGLTDDSAPVTYRKSSTAKNYAEFRIKLEELLQSGLLNDDQLDTAKSIIAPFDQKFTS